MKKCMIAIIVFLLGVTFLLFMLVGNHAEPQLENYSYPFAYSYYYPLFQNSSIPVPFSFYDIYGPIYFYLWWPSYISGLGYSEDLHYNSPFPFSGFNHYYPYSPTPLTISYDPISVIYTDVETFFPYIDTTKPYRDSYRDWTLVGLWNSSPNVEKSNKDVSIKIAVNSEVNQFEKKIFGNATFE